MELFKLTEEEIKEIKRNPSNAKWNNLCMFYDIPEDILRSCSKYLNWELVSVYQKLSEDFIRDFEQDVSWNRIIESQNLSDEFIKEYNYMF